METNLKNTEKKGQFKRWMTRKGITYVTVCGFLTFVNAYTTPHRWWVLWVIAGWGLSLGLSIAYYLTDCDNSENYKTN